MKSRAGWVLTAAAAASWGAVITIDALNLRTHAERDLLGVACVMTALALQWLFIIGPMQQAIDRQARAYTELAKAVATRPLDMDAASPHPALRAVQQNGRGRHAQSR